MAATDPDTLRERLGGARLTLLAGAAVGALGVLLSVLGNPRNSGICVSCFLENIAGSMGFHQDQRMMYIRPEIMGFLLGAFLITRLRGEFKPHGGSSPLVRFVLGFFIMVGCSVFIGCPIKMALRLSAGDLTALAGAGGLAAGILAGVRYLRGGYYLGRDWEGSAAAGYLMPGIMLLLLVALLWKPSFIGFSVSGPGSLHPAWYLSLAVGLAVGALAQRSRFCVTGSLRNIFLTGDAVAGLGLAGLFLSAAAAALLFGQFHPGLHDQPGAHPVHLWNFLGLFLVGFASVMVDGCPFRQLILSGEGNLDAGVTIMGLLMGGAAAYAWGIRSTAAGPTDNGKAAVLAGLIFCFLAANALRRRDEGAGGRPSGPA